MLVVTRKKAERIILRPSPEYAGETIVLTNLGIRNENQVRLGIAAPPSVQILREELDDGEPIDAAHAAAVEERRKRLAAPAGVTVETDVEFSPEI